MFGGFEEQAIGWSRYPERGARGGGFGLAGQQRPSNETAEHGSVSTSEISEFPSGAAEGGGVRFGAYFPPSSTRPLQSRMRDGVETPLSLLAIASDNLGLRQHHNEYHPHDNSPIVESMQCPNLTPVSTVPTTPPIPPPPSSVPAGMNRDTSEPTHLFPHSESHRIHLAPETRQSMDIASAHSSYRLEGACGGKPARPEENADQQSAGTDVAVQPRQLSATAEGASHGNPSASSSSLTANNWTPSATSWNNDLQPFGSSSNQLSSSLDSDVGGAILIPIVRETQASSAGIGRIYQEIETDTEDDDSEGGISFDIEMNGAGGQVEVYPSTPTPPTDETFSPSNLITRPLSSTGGEVLALSNQRDTTGEDLSMQLDSPVQPPSSTSTPHQAHSIPTALTQGYYLLHGPSNEPPFQDFSMVTPGEEEIQEIYVPDNGLMEDGRSTTLQDSLSGNPPSPERQNPPPPTSASMEFLSTFDPEGGFIVDTLTIIDFLSPPSPGMTNSFLENNPSLSAFPEYFLTTPPFLPELFTHPSATVLDSVSVAATYGADFSGDEDDAAQNTNDIVFDNNVMSQDLEQYNSDFAGFCKQLWNQQVLSSLREGYNQFSPHISAEGRRIAEWAKTRPDEITREDVEERGYDIQGIQWEKLELEKKAARKWRQARYQNYRNIRDFTKEGLPPIKSNREFYSFRRHNSMRCRLMHFQLRNVLAMADRNNIFFSTGEQVVGYHPITSSLQDPLMDLSEDGLSDPIRISALGGCGGRDAVLIAGGFNGTYALKALNANTHDPLVTGTLTEHDNGMTNHIQLIRGRRSGTPHAIISSNDSYIRIMDVADPGCRFIAQHQFDWAVNCSSSSPDSRLRAVVGDSKDVLIVDADRGRTEFILKGHQDFGFAAAWSEDGYSIATGNQDQTVRIFDARNFSAPVKALPMRMAGCRSLRFSPIGNGGKRVLAMAEPTDLVHLVDAVGFEDAQTLTFWGEIGGIEFTPDADEIVIANCDKHVGGLMTFSRRKGSAWYDDQDTQTFESPGGWKGVAVGRKDRCVGSRRWKRLGAELESVFV